MKCGKGRGGADVNNGLCRLFTPPHLHLLLGINIIQSNGIKCGYLLSNEPPPSLRSPHIEGGEEEEKTPSYFNSSFEATINGRSAIGDVVRRETTSPTSFSSICNEQMRRNAIKEPLSAAACAHARACMSLNGETAFCRVSVRG